MAGSLYGQVVQRSMKEVTDLEAMDQFAALLDLVERGEEVLITRRGKVVAKLVPVTPKASGEFSSQATLR